MTVPIYREELLTVSFRRSTRMQKRWCGPRWGRPLSEPANGALWRLILSRWLATLWFCSSFKVAVVEMLQKPAGWTGSLPCALLGRSAVQHGPAIVRLAWFWDFPRRAGRSGHPTYAGPFACDITAVVVSFRSRSRPLPPKRAAFFLRRSHLVAPACVGWLVGWLSLLELLPAPADYVLWQLGAVAAAERSARGPQWPRIRPRLRWRRPWSL